MMTDRMLAWFGEWFGSKLGIIETGLFALGWIALSRIGVVDKSGWWLLYSLTVYSAITQPVLAFIAFLSSRKLDDVMEALMRIERHNEQMLERLTEEARRGEQPEQPAGDRERQATGS